MSLPKPLTRRQVREVDRIAIEELGIPGIVLMEHAAEGAVNAALEMLGRPPAACHFAVCCGGGNNGGDGYAMARLLHNAGAKVEIRAAKPIDQLTGDAAINAAIVRNMRLPLSDNFEGLERADILIDALLGTGFSGEIRPPMDLAIERMNAAGKPILAVDLPSGLDCDTGIPANPTIRAAVTVTFVAPKVGFSSPAAISRLGKVVVADIGVPPSLIERVRRQGV